MSLREKEENCPQYSQPAELITNSCCLLHKTGQQSSLCCRLRHDNHCVMGNNFLMDGSCLITLQIYLHMEDEGAEMQFPYEKQLYSLALSYLNDFTFQIYLFRMQHMCMCMCMFVCAYAYTHIHICTPNWKDARAQDLVDASQMLSWLISTYSWGKFSGMFSYLLPVTIAFGEK